MWRRPTLRATLLFMLFVKQVESERTLASLCNIQEIIQNFERKKAIFVFFSNTGVEETLYLLLLVAKKNRKSVDIQNSKGKVKTEERKDNISK